MKNLAYVFFRKNEGIDIKACYITRIRIRWFLVTRQTLVSTRNGERERSQEAHLRVTLVGPLSISDDARST